MKKYFYALLVFTATLPAVSQKPVLQWYNFEKTSSNVGYLISSDRDALILTRISGFTYSDFYYIQTILNGKSTFEAFEMVDPSQTRFSTVYLEDSSYYKLIHSVERSTYDIRFFSPDGDSLYHIVLDALRSTFGYQGNHLIVGTKQETNESWTLEISRYDENGKLLHQKKHSFDRGKPHNYYLYISSYNPITVVTLNGLFILSDTFDILFKSSSETDKRCQLVAAAHPYVCFRTGHTWENKADSVFQYNVNNQELIKGPIPDNSQTIWYGTNKLIHLAYSPNSLLNTYSVSTVSGEPLFEIKATYLKNVIPLSDGGLAEIYFDNQHYPINKPAEVPAKIVKRSKDFSEDWSHTFTLNPNTYQTVNAAQGPKGSVYFLLNEQPYREPYFKPVFENVKYYYGQLASKTDECPPVYLSHTLNGRENCDSTLYSKLWFANLDSLTLKDLNIHLAIQWYQNGMKIEGPTSFSLKYDSLNNHQFKLTQEGCETYSELINEPEPLRLEIVPDKPEIGCNVDDYLILQFKINGEFIDPRYGYTGFTDFSNIHGTNRFSYYHPQTLNIHLKKNDNACLTAHQTFEIRQKTPLPQPQYALEEYGVIDPDKWGQYTQITGTARFEVIHPVADHTYEWFRNDESTGVSGTRFNAVSSGNYTVKASKEECFSMSQNLKLTLIPLATKSESRLSIYPNPSTDLLRIDWSEKTEPKSFRIYDMNGRMLRSEDIPASAYGHYDIYLKDLAEGNYLLHLISLTGTFKGKFSKKN